jgi:hypothetical protein
MPGAKATRDREQRMPGAAAQHRHDEQREQEVGHRQQTIDEAHDQAVDPAPYDAGGDADQRTEADAEQRGADAERDGRARPVQDAREEVAAELVRAEPERRRRALQACRRVEELGIVRGEPGAEDGGDQHDCQQDRAREPRGVAQKFTHSAPAGRAPR